MSLQVWLPLTGDLRNQGLKGENPSLMGSGITYTAGKIGQAATFPNNCNSCIHMPGLRLQVGTFASWILVKGVGATSRQCIISEGRDSYNDGVEIYASQAGTTIYFKAHEKVLSTTIELNKWYHISGVFGDGQIKLYLNGNLINTTTYTTDMTYQYANDLTLGKMSYSYTNTSNYFSFNGQLNDVRIYDHALSDKEVEEISKGLVLHYKLDDIRQDYSTNLVTSLTAGGQTTVANNVITTSGTNADTYFTINLSENIVEGTSYIISCDAEIPEGKCWTFPLGWQGNTSLSFQIYNGHNVYAFTANSGSWGTKRIFMDDGGSPNSVRSTGAQTKIFNFCVTKSGIINDSSGYNNNGVITGSLSTNTNSARYNSSIYTSSGNTNYITSPTIYLPGDQITMNFWFKSSNKSPGSDYHMPFEGTSNSNQSYEMSIYKTGYLRGGLVVGGSRKVDNCTSTKLTDGNWHMCTMTYDGATIKRYVDSIMEKSTAASGSLVTSTTFVLGHYGSNTSYCSKETYTSDIRLYTTALTEAQIKELYNTSASIDKEGNVYAREIIE